MVVLMRGWARGGDYHIIDTWITSAVSLLRDQGQKQRSHWFCFTQAGCPKQTMTSWTKEVSSVFSVLTYTTEWNFGVCFGSWDSSCYTPRPVAQR